MKRIFLCVTFLIGFDLFSNLAHTASDEFFKTKSTMLSGGHSGGGAKDDGGRFVAQQLGKPNPGNPDSLVQNLPGAGAVIAANCVYILAKPGGLSRGLITPSIYNDQLLGAKEAKFD